MYRFCRITYLGKSHFNFSSKNYSPKVYTWFVEFVGFCHTEHKKIGFAIFGFFYDFIWILQVAGKTQRKGKNHFASGLLERSGGSQLCPRFAQNFLEVSGALQCGPWAKGAARPAGFWRGQPDSGEAGGGDGRGSGGKWSRVRIGSI
jgi:hypothetical protein